jgi:hypothetical protein
MLTKRETECGRFCPSTGALPTFAGAFLYNCRHQFRRMRERERLSVRATHSSSSSDLRVTYIVTLALPNMAVVHVDFLRGQSTAETVGLRDFLAKGRAASLFVCSETLRIYKEETVNSWFRDQLCLRFLLIVFKAERRGSLAPT